MTKREAENQGLHYTGISFSNWDRKRAEEAKERVEAIKKAYKVRVVKVHDEKDWYSYYGDDNFCLVQHDTIGSVARRIEACTDRVEAAKEAYIKALKEIEEDRNRSYE